MVVVKRTHIPQERLGKDDLRLLIEAVNYCCNCSNYIWTDTVSDTRLELLIGKLKRMERNG